jgi:hypothetical protein
MPPLLIASAALASFAAVYAQLRIPEFTAGKTKVVLARTVLVLAGLGLGWVSASQYPGTPVVELLEFIAGFGVVHVPAALILFFKGQRHAGKS